MKHTKECHLKLCGEVCHHRNDDCTCESGEKENWQRKTPKSLLEENFARITVNLKMMGNGIIYTLPATSDEKEIPRCTKLVEDGNAICSVKLDCHLHDWRQREQYELGFRAGVEACLAAGPKDEVVPSSDPHNHQKTFCWRCENVGHDTANNRWRTALSALLTKKQ